MRNSNCYLISNSPYRGCCEGVGQKRKKKKKKKKKKIKVIMIDVIILGFNGYLSLYLTPLNPLSVRLFVRSSGKVICRGAKLSSFLYLCVPLVSIVAKFLIAVDNQCCIIIFAVMLVLAESGTEQVFFCALKINP